MCRSISEGGRRCPWHESRPNRIGASIRQRMSRYERRCETAENRGDFDEADKACVLFSKALEDYKAWWQEHRAENPSPTVTATTVDENYTSGGAAPWNTPDTPAGATGEDVADVDPWNAYPETPTDGSDPWMNTPTNAGAYTWESTIDWSDEQLATAWRQNDGDPQAQDTIMGLMDRRDQLERERDAEIAAMRAEDEARWAAVREEALGSPSPLTNPSRRTSRGLTAEQQCQEDYALYVESQYLKAENECRGTMINARGKAKGVTGYELFRGPVHVAKAYASEELQAWWRDNGRLTYTAYRYHHSNRYSDRRAAEHARLQDFGNVA